MAIADLKIRKDERTTEESQQFEADVETVSPDEPADPRPLPITHARHLDVNRVLERSLPRLSDEV